MEGNILNKEQLVSLGLTEEHADAVVTALETSQMIPKARFDEVNNAKKALEAQVTDYSAQLKTLQDSAIGNETLQKQIADLQEAQKTAKVQYEQQLKDAKVDAAIKLAINGKVHDVDMVAGLIDRALIQLDDNHNITSGLTEQFGALKESKSFLFVPEKQESTPQIAGAKPVSGIEAPPAHNQSASIGSTWAQKMNQQKQAPTKVWGV